VLAEMVPADIWLARLRYVVSQISVIAWLLLILWQEPVSWLFQDWLHYPRLS